MVVHKDRIGSAFLAGRRPGLLLGCAHANAPRFRLARRGGVLLSSECIVNDSGIGLGGPVWVKVQRRRPRKGRRLHFRGSLISRGPFFAADALSGRGWPPGRDPLQSAGGRRANKPCRGPYRGWAGGCPAARHWPRVHGVTRMARAASAVNLWAGVHFWLLVGLQWAAGDQVAGVGGAVG